MDDKMKDLLLGYLVLYGWRDEYDRDGVCDPYDYESEEEFLEAVRACENEDDF